MSCVPFLFGFLFSLPFRWFPFRVFCFFLFRPTMTGPQVRNVPLSGLKSQSVFCCCHDLQSWELRCHTIGFEFGFGVGYILFRNAVLGYWFLR